MNKRKNERRDCFVPVDGQDGGVFDRIQTIDFSEEGVGFISQKEIPLEKKIAVELDLGNVEESVVVVGKVKWVTPIEDTGNFRIGMHFEDLLSGSEEDLKSYFAKSGS